jgi:hypothetical protein
VPTNGATMRTHGFRTHVLLALAAAAGVVAALDRLWYAPAPDAKPSESGDIGDINGPLNALFEGIRRWVTNQDGSSGWDTLGHWGVALAAMAAVAGIGALACMVSALQPLGRDLLRYGAFAVFGIALWKLVDPPGTNATHELRHGALAAFGCAVVLLTCAMGVAKAPLRRKSPRRSYEAVPPPQAPPAYGTSGSSAPPGA